MQDLIYIAHYDTPESEQKRVCSPAGTAKIRYVLSAIERIGKKVKLISASCTYGKKSVGGSVKPLGNQSELILLPALRRGGKLINLIAAAFFRIYFFLYLLFHIKRKACVIVYHSLFLIRPVTWLKRLKKIRLVLEIEEIYGDVIGREKTVNRELKFFQIADAYIFPSAILAEKLNPAQKPSVVVHGTYQGEQDREVSFNDGKIHCVYSGTLDVRKGGAFAAAAAAYLPENYHIHILGFGSEMDIHAFQETVTQLKKTCKCGVSFDGCLSGEAYIRFIQACQIGLSTQDPNAPFNQTSFPSKILSYMANGLRVVSIRIPAIETSAIGKYLYYYEEQTAENIANAIMRVDLTDDYDSHKILKKLDGTFCEELKALIQAVSYR